MLVLVRPTDGVENACAAENPCDAVLAAAIAACEHATEQLGEVDSLDDLDDALDAVALCID